MSIWRYTVGAILARRLVRPRPAPHVHHYRLINGLCDCGDPHPTLGPARSVFTSPYDPRVLDSLAYVHYAALDALPTKSDDV